MNNSHKGENWPYHEDKNGNMVPCASNPCKLPGGTDIMATSPEDATEKKNSGNVWGYKPTEKENQVTETKTKESNNDGNSDSEISKKETSVKHSVSKNDDVEKFYNPDKPFADSDSYTTAEKEIINDYISKHNDVTAQTLAYYKENNKPFFDFSNDDDESEVLDYVNALNIAKKGTKYENMSNDDIMGYDADEMRNSIPNKDDNFVDDFVKKSTPVFAGSMYNHIVGEEQTKDFNETPIYNRKDILVKLATRNAANDADISDYAGFIESSLNDTLEGADIKGFADSNDKDNLKLKKDSETDDKALIIAKLQYDPDGPGGSASDYVASAVNTAFTDKSIHVKDRTKLENEVKARIFTTALDPMKSCAELGIKTRPIEEDMNGKIFYDSRVFGPTGDFL